jgi:hypothetical protein
MQPETVRDAVCGQAVARQIPWVRPHKVDKCLLEAEAEAKGVIELLEPGTVGVASASSQLCGG